jgi:malonate decarboxylase epsilon subunit
MTALLFPGQGAQRSGFLHDLPDDPQVAATLAEAAEVLGEDVLALDNAEALESTVAVQLTVLIAGVAVARALVARGVRPSATVGLSVGSFTAAVAADAIDFADALRLVRLRATLMGTAYPSGYGLAAFEGLSARRLTELAQAIQTPDQPLYLANLNAPTEIVVTGADAALEALMRSAQAAGARRAQRLAVTVPSHCPLMDGVAARLGEAVQAVPIRPPRLTYVGNRRARVLRDAAAVREELGGNVSHPVLWYDSTNLLYELGERVFIEPPPGAVLTGLIMSAFKDVDARAAAQTPLETLAFLASRPPPRSG